MADGQWAVAGDNVDDALTNSSHCVPQRAKTIGLRCDHTALGATKLDTLLSVGGAPPPRINVGSSGYTYPGIFCLRRSGRYRLNPLPVLYSNSGAAFTLVFAYNEARSATQLPAL